MREDTIRLERQSPRRKIALGLLASTTLFLSACSFSNHPNSAVINSLRNRGAVPLSSQNPYLAGNILLSSEMSRSPELNGFITKRGAPKAIEVVKSWSGPTLIRLYYTDKQEYYVAESSGGSWIIQGPKSIPPKGMKLLISIVETSQAPALLEVEAPSTSPVESWKQAPVEPLATANGDQTPLFETTNATQINELPAKPSSPTVSPTAHADDPVVAKVIELQSSVTDMAEVSPRGDLVHYVTYSGETLSVISRWYTLDARNVGRISRINNLKDPSQLEIGDTVIIPSYIVKNKARLTEEVLRALLVAISKQNSN